MGERTVRLRPGLILAIMTRQGVPDDAHHTSCRHLHPELEHSLAAQRPSAICLRWASLSTADNIVE